MPAGLQLLLKDSGKSCCFVGKILEIECSMSFEIIIKFPFTIKYLPLLQWATLTNGITNLSIKDSIYLALVPHVHIFVLTSRDHLLLYC